MTSDPIVKSAALVSTIPASSGTHNATGLLQILRDFVESDSFSIPPSVTRKLLGADLRTECSLALLRTVTAFKKLEPWALRLFDATGKYPTGFLQLTRADIGAFDECLETQVRDASGNVISQGQYCSLFLNVKKNFIGEKEIEFLASILHPKLFAFTGSFIDMQAPLIRLGMCFLDDCTQRDLQALMETMRPDPVDIRVENCVTATPEPWSTTQIVIVAFLTTLVIVIAWATAVDLYTASKRNAEQKDGVLLKAVMVFSAARNTRTLLHVADKTNPDQCHLCFLHGMRTISAGHIVIGHCYQIMSDTWGRYLNMMIATDSWGSMIVTSAFDSVDTFFFLSGFLLAFVVSHQKCNGPLVFLTAVVRRLIRTCVPLFFVIMCIYALPRFVSGPDTKRFFEMYDEEIAETWWALLLQMRNFIAMSEQTLLLHLWYLSADFQLFVVSLLILLVLKNRRKIALGTFTIFSILGCAVTLWTATNPEVLPFMTYPAYTKSILLASLNLLYIRPFAHAICFFSGCMTLMFLEDFRNRKISKSTQLAGWSIATICTLCVIFMKIPWYKHRDPTSESVKLLAAITERIMWSLFLVWLTLACATGRGGFITRFLSSSFFAPLSRLSFGVYLIHYPFILLMLHASRERVLWSHFTQVTLFFGVFIWSCLLSYMAFLTCEAPTAGLDKLVFKRLIGRQKPATQERRPEAGDAINLGSGQLCTSPVKL